MLFSIVTTFLHVILVTSWRVSIIRSSVIPATFTVPCSFTMTKNYFLICCVGDPAFIIPGSDISVLPLKGLFKTSYSLSNS